jgi:hypothetical protein
MKIFSNQVDKDSFFSHVKSAHPLTRFGIYTALALKYTFGAKLGRVPVLKIVDGSISALVKMHEGSVNTASLAGSKDCDFQGYSDFLDLIVVGSGPGAGIVALKNQQIGKSVLVIEKGTELDHSVPHHSPEQMKYFFESGGQELIFSVPPIPFAQGSVLGGGSEINSGLYHRLPSKILENWLQKTGISSELWHKAELEVERDLYVASQSFESLGIYSDSPIARMQENLNWEGGLIPRWRTYRGHSFTHHGMVSTYIERAKEHGAVISSNHFVDRIRLIDGGVEVVVKCATGIHKVRARQVCLAGGTIGSPTLLWRSRLARPSDFRFSFHAMVREIARFGRDVSDLNDIDPFQAWSASNEYKIGAAVSTPRLLAATLASKGLPLPKLEAMSKLGVYYISLKSRGKNGLFAFGSRLVPYFWPDKIMKESLLDAQRILRGAIESTGGEALGNSGPSVSTVHIFGSLPIGETTVVDNQGMVKGTGGRVFVRDGSLLPSHPSVNPQGPLMHLIYSLEEERLNDN